MILDDSSLFPLELHIASSCKNDAQVFVVVRFTRADIPGVKTSVDTRNSRLVGFAALSLKDGSDHGLIKQLGIFVISDRVLHLKKGPKKLTGNQSFG
jgi:hypothetical protein